MSGTLKDNQLRFQGNRESKIRYLIFCINMQYMPPTQNSWKGNSKESDPGPPGIVGVKVGVGERNVTIQMQGGQEDVKHENVK